MILLVAIVTTVIVLMLVAGVMYIVQRGENVQEVQISPTICYNEGTADPYRPGKCVCKAGTFGPNCGLVCLNDGKEDPQKPGHCKCPAGTSGNQCENICPVGRTKVLDLPAFPESRCNETIGAGMCDQTTGKCVCKNRLLFDPDTGCNLTFAAQLGADSAARSIRSVVSGVCKNLTDQPAATMANFFRYWSEAGFPTGTRAKVIFAHVCRCKIDSDGKCTIPPPPEDDDEDDDDDNDDERWPDPDRWSPGGDLPKPPVAPGGKIPPPLPPKPPVAPGGKIPPPLPPKPNPRPDEDNLPPPPGPPPVLLDDNLPPEPDDDLPPEPDYDYPPEPEDDGWGLPIPPPPVRPWGDAPPLPFR